MLQCSQLFLVFCFPTHTVILGLVPSPHRLSLSLCLSLTILLARFPYGVGMMTSQPSAPVQYTGQPTGPGGQVRPLFPSAQPGTPSPGPPASRATFPAYSEHQGEPEKKPQLIASTGSSSKIIHPPEDISLVSRKQSADLESSLINVPRRRRCEPPCRSTRPLLLPPPPPVVVPPWWPALA